MANGIVPVPKPINDPISSYAPGSPEKASLKAKINEMLGEEIEIPLIIGGKEVRTGNTAKAVCPHDHRHVLGVYHKAGEAEVANGRRRRGRGLEGAGRRCPGSTEPP